MPRKLIFIFEYNLTHKGGIIHSIKDHWDPRLPRRAYAYVEEERHVVKREINEILEETEEGSTSFELNAVFATAKLAVAR